MTTPLVIGRLGVYSNGGVSACMISHPASISQNALEILSQAF
jgi:hypothetical protein